MGMHDLGQKGAVGTRPGQTAAFVFGDGPPQIGGIVVGRVNSLADCERPVSVPSPPGGRMPWLEMVEERWVFSAKWGEKEKHQPISTGVWCEERLLLRPERKTGFEPATFSLARRRPHSTAENAVTLNHDRLRATLQPRKTNRENDVADSLERRRFTG